MQGEGSRILSIYKHVETKLHFRRNGQDGEVGRGRYEAGWLLGTEGCLLALWAREVRNTSEVTVTAF
jgi:hypothetical protein